MQVFGFAILYDSNETLFFWSHNFTFKLHVTKVVLLTIIVDIIILIDYIDILYYWYIYYPYKWGPISLALHVPAMF